MKQYTKENTKFDDGKGLLRFYHFNCVVCGDSFWSRSDRARYCSQRCVNDAKIARKKARMAAKREQHKNCAVCGKPLVQDATQKIRKYCSAACKQKFYRQQKALQTQTLK